MTGPDTEDWLRPDWRPHSRVRVAVTTRAGDFSPPPWQGFNLGLNTGDDPERVRAARVQVHTELSTPHAPACLRQVHGTRVVPADDSEPEADGVWTGKPGQPCGVLTADCLPVLLARRDGTAVGAFHAGWRGLQAGILDAAVESLAPAGENLAAWLGPAICRRCYQVGEDVRQAFIARDPDADNGFDADPEPGRWRADLHHLAERVLRQLGVEAIERDGHCTVCHNHRFYSHRNEGPTGRFASLIWLE